MTRPLSVIGVLVCLAASPVTGQHPELEEGAVPARARRVRGHPRRRARGRSM